MLDYSNDKYNNKMKYPKQSDFMVYYVYKEGKVVHYKLTVNDLDDMDLNIRALENTGHTIEMVIDQKAYTKAKQDYQANKDKLYNKWIADLSNYYGIDFVNDPVGKIIFNAAWQDGHSSGYSAVDMYIEEYTAMIDDVLANANNSKYASALVKVSKKQK